MQPEHDTFVGVDSDGCVFDTMEVKQKQCFHPVIIAHWHLEPIGKYVRQTAEFVNLYSKWRGTNRFRALKILFDLLAEREEVQQSGVKLPATEALGRFIESGVALGNPALAQAVAQTADPDLDSLLRWSEAVNAEVARVARNVPAFAWAKEGLERISAHSDAICVSQTPGEALMREWQQHELAPCVRVIAGQELGTKAEQLALAAAGKYGAGRVLMIGDALGDLEAARACRALFFPIGPGHEAECWQRFCEEGYGRFLAGDFAGSYETALIEGFKTLLPETPPWSR
ncbi:MAG: HAD family hydrolase [Kiritimatiellae bacterium]|nr:HAD family hydrolase [Kiritimatiellia bacterium]